MMYHCYYHEVPVGILQLQYSLLNIFDSSQGLQRKKKLQGRIQLLQLKKLSLFLSFLFVQKSLIRVGGARSSNLAPVVDVEA